MIWEALLTLLRRRPVCFSKHKVKEIRPPGSQSCWLTDSRYHLTPGCQQTGQPDTVLPDHQMSAARHAATTTCKARSSEGSRRQAGTQMTLWMASVEAS